MADAVMSQSECRKVFLGELSEFPALHIESAPAIRLRRFVRLGDKPHHASIPDFYRPVKSPFVLSMVRCATRRVAHRSEWMEWL